MKNRFIKLLLAAVLLGSLSPAAAQTREMDLSGEWRFQTDVMDFRRGSLSPRYNHQLQETIMLPGITDDYKIGYKSPYRHVDRLTRVYEYMGPAWYQRDIEFPADWKGKCIFLYFERTHWLSSVWVDTKEVSRLDYISVPHNHDLTDFVTPGKTHRITVCIDNRFQYNTHKWNHAHTEFTQINWNGILGEMKLVAVDPVYIDDMQLYPDLATNSVRVEMAIENHTKKPFEGRAQFTVTGSGLELTREFPVSGDGEKVSLKETLQLGKEAKLWDEFNPNLYTVDVHAADRHRRKSPSNIRSRRPSACAKWRRAATTSCSTAVRSTCAEPSRTPCSRKRATPRSDDAEWERIMRIVKDYGLEPHPFPLVVPSRRGVPHGRPATASTSKSRCPCGARTPSRTKRATTSSAARCAPSSSEYGNHPSFVLYCNGNEITGNFDFIEELTADGRKLDTRHLYSGSTARTRVPSDQYYVSQQTNKGPVKVYEGRPSTDWERSKESDVDVPVISHESGQRCVYPDFREIGKYTGPVEARNFELWREMLTANGMGDQAHDFFRASGALTVVEYKAVIEALLRSSKSAGFQLLSLNDFPGQGYAPVGVLDPFWDSKGLVTPEDWRAFCAPTVALLRYPKSAWFEDETFTAKAEVYNFGAAALKNAKIRWSITDGSGKAIAKGSLKSQTVGTDGVFPVGEFSAPLGKVRGPQKLTVHLNVGEKTSNSWDIWVYPRNAQLMQSDTEVLYTTEFGEQAKQYLAAGKKVVLTPAPNKVKGRKSTFHNHFWNPIMFAWAPMTIGCLIHAEQPVFADFPTSYHTDWQWWDILENAKVIEMQQTPRQLRPFIQVIDSFDNNEKLGIGFEARVGGGKLLVLAVDTKKKMDQRPATRQLLESIDRYVRSDRFAPEVTLDESFITSFMR